LSQQTQSFDIHDDDVHDTYENNNKNAFEKENGEWEFLHQKHHFAIHIPNFVFSKLSKF
jgi:hypothetical protein